MRLKITCACGWEVEGEDREVIAATQEHGGRLHNMEVTADEARAMATILDQ